MSHDRGCSCGREPYDYNDCTVINCYKREKTVINNEPKQYLWVKEGRAPMFVIDLVELYKDRNFDSAKDKVYEVGAEVKLELNVKVTPAKPVYRENASGYRTPFENRD